MQRGTLLLKLWLERLGFTAFLWLDSAVILLCIWVAISFMLLYYFITLHSKFKRILKCIDP